MAPLHSLPPVHFRALFGFRNSGSSRHCGALPSWRAPYMARCDLWNSPAEIRFHSIRRMTFVMAHAWWMALASHPSMHQY